MRSEIYSLMPYIWGGTPSAFGSSPSGGAKGAINNNFLRYMLLNKNLPIGF